MKKLATPPKKKEEGFTIEQDLSARFIQYKYNGRTICSFNYLFWPSCCLAAILFDLYLDTGISDENYTKIQEAMKSLFQRYEVTTIYYHDIPNHLFYQYAKNLGFIPSDINFNQNSGNNVVLFKRVLSW